MAGLQPPQAIETRPVLGRFCAASDVRSRPGGRTRHAMSRAGWHRRAMQRWAWSVTDHEEALAIKIAARSSRNYQRGVQAEDVRESLTADRNLLNK